jgi:hypothetical protein
MSGRNLGGKETGERGLVLKFLPFLIFHIVSIDFSTKFIKQVFI